MKNRSKDNSVASYVCSVYLLVMHLMIIIIIVKVTTIAVTKRITIIVISIVIIIVIVTHQLAINSQQGHKEKPPAEDDCWVILSGWGLFEDLYTDSNRRFQVSDIPFICAILQNTRRLIHGGKLKSNESFTHGRVPTCKQQTMTQQSSSAGGSSSAPLIVDCQLVCGAAWDSTPPSVWLSHCWSPRTPDRPDLNKLSCTLSPQAFRCLQSPCYPCDP